MTDLDLDADRIDALCDAYALKDERRTGWQLRGVVDPESVAGHAWGVAFLCLLFGERAGVDVERALELAVVHDVAEAETGDVATRVDPEAQEVTDAEKHAREREAMEGFAATLDDDLLERWEAYEALDTPEARFVKDMDLLDACLQALVYERGGRYERGDNPNFERFDALDEFFATAEPRIGTNVGRRLFEQVREAYERARDER